MRTHENEPFVLQRDVKAVMVPAGIEIELKSGQSGFITQALGGCFTLYMEGNLFRLAGAEADAIGKEVVKAPELPPNATEDDVLALAWEQLRTCYDPEIPINIVDLGLIYECTVGVQPDGQRVMVHVLRDRRFLDVVLGSAVLTAIAGAILFWRDSNGLDVGFILGAGVGFGSAVSPGCWLCSCSFSPDIRAPAGL